MDWDNDGKKDLISGDFEGQIWVFLNKGTKTSPKLQKGFLVKIGGKPIKGYTMKYEKGKLQNVSSSADKHSGMYSKLHYADWDGDGLEDILVGQDGPKWELLVWYKNIGKKGKPEFAKSKVIKDPLPQASRPSPYLIDLDQDGKRDMVYGTGTGPVYFFRNTGTTKKPKWGKGVILKLDCKDFKNFSPKGGKCRIDVADWNNDGKLDILVGNLNNSRYGNVWLFLGK